MPNIEIHGFNLVDSARVKNCIWKASSNFQHSDFSLDACRKFLDDAVVTTVPSEAQNKNGRMSPFVRVFFGHDWEKWRAKEVLSEVPNLYKCVFDVEFLRTAHFCSFPAKTV